MLDQGVEALRLERCIVAQRGAHQRLDLGEIVGGEAAEGKTAFVGVNGDAVQFNGARDGRKRERHETFLERIAEHEQIGGDGIAHQRRGERSGVDTVAVARRRFDRLEHLGGLEIDVRLEDEGRGRLRVAVDDGLGGAGPETRQRYGARGDHRIAGQQHIGAARGDAHRVKVFRLWRQPHMAHHRAVLLRKPADVEHGAAFAFEMRRHAKERAQRDDAGAADAGDEDAVGPIERRRFWLR